MDFDLVGAALATVDGTLDRMELKWKNGAVGCVVMAAGGYPADYAKGDVIAGLPSQEEPNVKLFHAGTARKNGQVVTSGGRVLCATALGDTVREAQTRAYNLAKRVSWRDVYYRTDIGYRAVAREQGKAPLV